MDERFDYTDVQAAKDFFINDKFAMVTSGIDIVLVDNNYAKCKMVVDERHKNAVGQVMGGAIYTLADFTFAVATNFGHPATVTVVSQITYFSVMKGDTLFAESKLIKDGKRNCFYEIEITDDLGTLIAKVNTTGAHIGK